MQRYLLFQHDSHTQKPVRDENGDMILREGYLMDALNCDPFTFNTGSFSQQKIKARFAQRIRRKSISMKMPSAT